MLSLDYMSLPKNVESTVTLSSTASGTLHAVAIWVDYQLDESARWSTFGGVDQRGGGNGRSITEAGAHEKQLLRFLPRAEKVVTAQGEGGVKLKVSGCFHEEGGCMTFDVSVV